MDLVLQKQQPIEYEEYREKMGYSNDKDEDKLKILYSNFLMYKVNEHTRTLFIEEKKSVMSPDKIKEFVEACENGNKDEVEALIHLNPNQDLNVVIEDWFGHSSFLNVCVNNGHIKIAEMLILKGANPNNPNCAWSALHIAVMNEDIKMIIMLFTNGANVNIFNKYHQTPLMSTIYLIMYEYEIVKLLISNGADVNIKDSDGNTPLHIAVRSNKKDKVELLIDNGALIEARNNEDQRPIDFASDLEMREILATSLHNID